MEAATGIVPPSHFVSKIAGSLPEPEDWGQVCPGPSLRKSKMHTRSEVCSVLMQSEQTSADDRVKNSSFCPGLEIP